MQQIQFPHFGVHFVPAMPLAALIDAADALTRRGVEELSLSDEAFCLEPLTLLAALAARHPALRLGVRVTNPYIRHPLTLAREVRVIAALSEAEVALGLALGGAMSLNATGAMARRRVRDVIDTLTAVRVLLAGEHVRHTSALFTLDAALEGEPAGRVRFEIAGRGPRMLAAAAAHADAVLLVGMPRDEGVRTIAAIRAAAAQAGRATPPAITWATHAVTDEALLEDIAPYMAYGLAEATTADRGCDAATVAAVQQALRDHGRVAAGKLVPREYIGARVALGTPDECRAQLTAFAREQGIARVLLRVPYGASFDRWLDAACAVATPPVAATH
jgi:5,10-methylenetetrahydromethanopterin reductase